MRLFDVTIVPKVHVENIIDLGEPSGGSPDLLSVYDRDRPFHAWMETAAIGVRPGFIKGVTECVTLIHVRGAPGIVGSQNIMDDGILVRPCDSGAYLDG